MDLVNESNPEIEDEGVLNIAISHENMHLAHSNRKEASAFLLGTFGRQEGELDLEAGEAMSMQSKQHQNSVRNLPQNRMNLMTP